MILVPEFKLGADPEFTMLFDGWGKKKNPDDFEPTSFPIGWFLSYEGDFGLENNAINEIRVPQHHDPLVVTARIRILMNDAFKRIPQLRNIAWLAGGHQFIGPTGGHVHMSHSYSPDFISNIPNYGSEWYGCNEDCDECEDYDDCDERYERNDYWDDNEEMYEEESETWSPWALHVQGVLDAYIYHGWHKLFYDDFHSAEREADGYGFMGDMHFNMYSGISHFEYRVPDSWLSSPKATLAILSLHKALLYGCYAGVFSKEDMDAVAPYYHHTKRQIKNRIMKLPELLGKDVFPQDCVRGFQCLEELMSEGINYKANMIDTWELSLKEV